MFLFKGLHKPDHFHDFSGAFLDETDHLCHHVMFPAGPAQTIPGHPFRGVY